MKIVSYEFYCFKVSWLDDYKVFSKEFHIEKNAVDFYEKMLSEFPRVWFKKIEIPVFAN